jgi:hypothetical protein
LRLRLRERGELQCAEAQFPEDSMTTEEHKIDGQHLLSRVKEIVHEGNVRRIIIKNEQGQSLLEIPLSIGVVGAVLMPVWVAIGAIAALTARYTLVVEKDVPPA